MFYSEIQHIHEMENVMENGHVSALNAKHDALETRIRDEMSRPLPDMFLVAEMKKRKLRLKEELYSA